MTKDKDKDEYWYCTGGTKAYDIPSCTLARPDMTAPGRSFSVTKMETELVASSTQIEDDDAIAEESRGSCCVSMGQKTALTLRFGRAMTSSPGVKVNWCPAYKLDGENEMIGGKMPGIASCKSRLELWSVM
jgi:hypothetical protein